MSKNATIKDRTLPESLLRAERTRSELPSIVQVHPRDWDVVILADEVYRLRKELEYATKSRRITKSPYDLSESEGLRGLFKRGPSW